MSNSASRFKAMLKQRGYNMTRLADEMGMTRTQMSNRVSGTVKWTWSDAIQVTSRLSITFEEFREFFPEFPEGRGAA